MLVKDGPRLVLVAVNGKTDDFSRPLDTYDTRPLFAAYSYVGRSCYSQRHAFESKIYSHRLFQSALAAKHMPPRSCCVKPLALLRAVQEVPNTSWLLWADTDAWLLPSAFSLNLAEWLDTAVPPNKHVVMGPSAKLNAAVLIVRNSLVGRRFLEKWAANCAPGLVNQDMAALQMTFLRMALPGHLSADLPFANGCKTECNRHFVKTLRSLDLVRGSRLSSANNSFFSTFHFVEGYGAASATTSITTSNASSPTCASAPSLNCFARCGGSCFFNHLGHLCFVALGRFIPMYDASCLRSLAPSLRRAAQAFLKKRWWLRERRQLKSGSERRVCGGLAKRTACTASAFAGCSSTSNSSNADVRHHSVM